MKQYWTPLARLLGMVKTVPDEESAMVLTQTAFTSATVAAQSTWPELFLALRTHAQRDWVVRSQRHAEVSPQQRLAITRLQIRATSLQLDAQLRQWFSEGDVTQLIQWMARGPWHTAEIERWVSWDTLTQLDVLPMSAPSVPNFSPYDVDASAVKSHALAYEIVADTQWCSQPIPAEDHRSWSPLELRIEDAQGQHSVHVMQTLMVLGAEKTLKTAEGQRLVLKDQSPVTWEGETAWFMAIAAQNVSGIHLVIRRQHDGFACLDAGSTNGTFVQNQRLEPGHWHLVKHQETLFLGGPASDPRSMAARIMLRVGHPVQGLGADRTPLRMAVPTKEEAPPLLMLIPQSGPHKHPVAVRSLTFTVGRDADCDWVIPPACEMVSRYHLVIEALDEPHQKLKLRDLSRQGLTLSREGWYGSAAEGVWVAWSDVITLGATARHAGLSFGFSEATYKKPFN